MATDFIEEPVEGSGSDGLGTGLVVVTTIVLITAWVLVDMCLGTYGGGMLFK